MAASPAGKISIFPATLYGIPRAERKRRIEEALHFMGLTDFGRKLVKTYSGGMIRRLEIAQAMLHRPAVLFLDEPTIGLDPVARRTVWERLLELRQNYQHDRFDHHARHGRSRRALRFAGHHASRQGRRRRNARGAESAAWDRTPRSTTSSFITAGAPSRRKEITVTSARPDAQLAVSADPPAVPAFFQQTAAIAEIELKKLLRDPTEVLARAVQPVLWIVIFGKVFSRVRAHSHRQRQLSGFHDARHPGAERSVRGHLLRHRRDLGTRSGHRAQASGQPRACAPRWSMARRSRRAFAALMQASIIYLVALVMRHPDSAGNRCSMLGVLFGAMLGSAIFATFSFIIACLVKSRERFMGMGQLMTMPLFFASNAIYPIAIMPHWLQVVALLNPLTYLVDALRGPDDRAADRARTACW